MENERIKFKDIKTLKQGEIVADRYYQRAHSLRAVWENEKESPEKRKKALFLFMPLVYIVSSLTLEYSRIINFYINATGEPAGIISGNESIINKLK